MNLRKLLAVLLLPVFSVGCNAGSDDDFADAEVTNLNTQDELIGLTEGTVLTAFFTFDQHGVFEEGETVALVVKLPQGLEFRDGTAELAEVNGDKDIGPEVTQCSSGESYLLFDMHDFHLDDLSDPSGDALGKLTLTVDAKQQGPWLVQAKARRDVVFFGCTQEFIGDRSVYVTVDPRAQVINDLEDN